MRKFQTFLGVLLSVLLVPTLMLLPFEILLRTSLGDETFLAKSLYLGFPLGVVLWYLLVGTLLKKKGLLSRKALWLWMNLLGYPLAWVALLLRLPTLAMQGFLLVSLLLPITTILLLAWGLVGLGFLLRRLVKSPPNPRKLRALGKKLLQLLTAIAAINVLISGGRYLNVRPADAYTDEGVYTFIPTEGYPTNVKAPGRQKTRNVYKVVYRTTKQSPYTWTIEAPSRSAGEAAVRAKEPVDRRVLSVTGTDTFLTIPPEETAESHTSKERNKCLLVFGISAAYLTAAAVIMIWRKRKAEDRAAEALR